jgi:hypothetical protein
MIWGLRRAPSATRRRYATGSLFAHTSYAQARISVLPPFGRQPSASLAPYTSANSSAI